MKILEKRFERTLTGYNFTVLCKYFGTRWLFKQQTTGELLHFYSPDEYLEVIIKGIPQSIKSL